MGQRRRQLWTAAAVAWVALLLFTQPCSGREAGAPTALKPRVESDTLLVALVDGSLAALDATSGAFLWRFATREPLLSSSLTWTGGEGAEGVAPTAVFPGADGALFAYQLATGSVEKLPLGARDLVAASPSVSHDGAVVVGSRKASAYALDPHSGAVLHAFTPRTLEDDDLGDVLSDVGLEDALLVGRTQYTVRSLDASTGRERWNVTFSELHPLRMRADAVGDDGDRRASGPSIALPGSASDAELKLVPGTDASLRSFGPDGWVRWAVHLGSPVVALFRSAGGRSFVPVPIDSATPAAGRDESPLVAVGIHMQGLFALPAPAITSTQPLHPRRRVTTPALGSGFVDPTTGMAGHALRSEAHGLVPAVPWVPPPPSSTDGLPSYSGGGSSAALQLVRVSDPGPKDYDWLPALGPGGTPLPGGNVRALAGQRGRGLLSTASAVGITTALLAAGTGGALVMRASMTRRASSLVPYSKAAEEVNSQGEQLLGASSPAPKRKSRNKRKSKAARQLRLDGEEDDGESGSEGDVEPNGVANGDSRTSANNEPHANGDSSSADASTSSAAPAPQAVAPVAERLPSGALRVGRLHVGPGVLGYGSCGTVVFEGSLDGRPVAVKRLLLHFHDLAKKELAALIRSDEHPAVLRCFAMEEDEHFVYVALERCACTLADLMELHSSATAGGRSDGVGDEGDTSASTGALLRKDIPPLSLFEPDGSPTVAHWTLMRDISSGLAALHQKGIIHRDVKPHNVLITPTGRAKLSDMGLSRALQPGEASSLHGTLPGSAGAAGAGTLGWRAPERLRPDGRQGRGVDVWALGCVLFYCLTGGHHPFGDSPLARDGAVASGRQPDLQRLAAMPEAQDLLRQLLAHDPGARPSAGRALSHPFWWPPDMRLAFLVDASDRVELEDREHNSRLLAALEAVPSTDMNFPWDKRLHAGLLDNVGRYRRYNAFSVRDLLRIIRNKRAHWRELPAEVRAVLGPPPGQFWTYFAERFPQLLLYVHRFMSRHCASEPHFGKYFHADDEAALSAFARLAPPSTDSGVEEQIAADDGGVDTAAGLAAGQRPVSFPERQGVQDCTYYLKTGRCKFGERCIFNHPRVVPGWRGQTE